MSTRPRRQQSPVVNPPLTPWTHQQLIGRFTDARLSLRVSVEKSRHLRTIRERERIADEGRRLRHVNRELVAERAVLVAGIDPGALQRLALRIASYYQQLGALESAAERIFGRHGGEEKMKQMGL
jgi:hypothetical protein